MPDPFALRLAVFALVFAACLVEDAISRSQPPKPLPPATAQNNLDSVPEATATEAAPTVADAANPASPEWPTDVIPGNRRWVLIVTTLPGDAEHARLFRKTADAWEKWFIETLGVPREQVLRLPDPQSGEADSVTELTLPELKDQVVELRERLTADDSLWLMTLGHGSHDGKRAWLHLAGRDPSEIDLAGWLSEMKCREQVLWLTHSSSGWMVKALSRPGRVVIAATAADDESNETEFPHALTTVMDRNPESVDADKNGRLSVLELYRATLDEVVRRFKKDGRLETESAQLDDDGISQAERDKQPAPGTKGAVPARLLLSASSWIPDQRLLKAAPTVTPPAVDPAAAPDVSSETTP